MPRLRSFLDRVAVVTGAASGIGRALARELGSRGAHVALVDVDAGGLAETAAKLGSNCTVHVADVSDRERMRALPEEVLSAHGRVQLLINNAGIATVGTVAEQDLEDHDRMMAVNFMGVVHGCKFFAPVLSESRPAWIVNNASVLGLLGVNGRSAYCASKFAVRGFSEALAQELAGSDIGVTVVYAGAVDTNIVRRARFHDPRVKERFVGHFEQRGLQPDPVARQILGAVQRGKARAVIGPDAKAIYRLKRLAPIRADAWLNRAFERQMGLTEIHREALDDFLARGNEHAAE